VAQIAVQLVVSIFSNTARVEDDDVGIILIARLFISVSRQKARDAFRVMLIHLAPVSTNDIAARHGSQASGGVGKSEPFDDR